VRCPNCHNKVIQKTGDVTRIRAGGPVEFGSDGLCRTKCHWCKHDVVLPLQLKAEAVIPAERFLIPSHKP
jgi:uncharacterized protein YodC (DUF2158 family)